MSEHIDEIAIEVLHEQRKGLHLRISLLEKEIAKIKKAIKKNKQMEENYNLLYSNQIPLPWEEKPKNDTSA